MSHRHRFHFDPSTPTSGRMQLSAAEAHHAIHVVRVKPGDEALLFDGAGRELGATVRQVSRRDVELEIGSERHETPESRRISLCVGWPKRAKAVEFIIEHGTEVGVQHFCFFRAERSEKRPVLDEKWTRTAIEACKQCGRLWLPTFATAETLESALDVAEGMLWLCTQQRSSTPTARGVVDEVSVVIGPEGDFTEEELDLATQRGAQPMSLGKYTLRTEMACIVAAVLARRILTSDCAD